MLRYGRNDRGKREDRRGKKMKGRSWERKRRERDGRLITER